jgi:MFS family permease
MLGLPIGVFLSGVCSGLIARAWGWRAAFLVATVPGLLLAIAISRITEPSRVSVSVSTSTGSASTGSAAREAVTVTGQSVWAPYLELWRIPTLRWIVVSGALHNFNSYAVNAFMPAYLGRYHGLQLAQANIVAGITLGLVGVLALAVGGVAADRSRVWRRDGRLILGTVALGIGTPAVFFALSLSPGAVAPFMALMGFGWMCSYLYYATVYAAIHDVVPARLRGTAMAVYFFWMYVLGGAFGPVILGTLSDRFARRAMAAGGGTAMTDAFKASGLHDAFFVVPAVMLTLTLVLFAASRTISKDIERVRA